MKIRKNHARRHENAEETSRLKLPFPGSMDISIIIVNWRSFRYLEKCLDTLFREEVDLEIEVIVIDNASYDGCDAMLAERYPQVKFIQNPVNIGFAGANNLGYRACRGNTLLFLNPDTEIVRQAIPTMHKLLWESDNAGVIGCTLLNSDGSIQTSCIQRFPRILNQVLNAELLRRLLPRLSLWGTRPLFEKNRTPLPVEMVSGACMMVKRRAFESAGLFSTDYFMYAEDADLCHRIRDAGFFIYYTGAVSVIHHGGGSSNQRDRNYFSDVVMRESIFRYLMKFHGSYYSYLYCMAMGIASFFRILLLGIIFPLFQHAAALHSLRTSLGRWVKIFRWASGCEEWTRHLSREHPPIVKPEYTAAGNEYVLITAAYNEEAFIGATMQAVRAQSVKPLKWVIVSDGSMDNTDFIIKRHAAGEDFIEYIRREKTDTSPSFISKVRAIQTGLKAISDVKYRFIGILDADITFSADYYERIIRKMNGNTRLGIAGGFIHERRRGNFRSRPANSKESVAGGIQFFRRECYGQIGGHSPLPYGGEDWLCEIMARKNGWMVEAFPEIVAYHHNPSETKNGALKNAIRLGRMDYSVGSHPLFELLKCIRRYRERPFLLKAFFRLLGFIWSTMKRNRKTVSADTVHYLRTEQMNRLKMSIHAVRQ